MIAITGTPGTGKTSVAEELKKKGYRVYSVNELAKDCIIDYEDGCAIVDIEKLKEKAKELEPDSMVEGHLSHHLADKAIVLRCNPLILKERLIHRGWREEKVLENVEAELVDAILIECLETCREVYEIDTTSRSPEEVAEIIVSIISDRKLAEKFKPGKIDWIAEVGDRIEEIMRM